MAQDEIDRIAGLLRYDILDTAAEQQFNDAVLLLRNLCDVPIALVSLVDSDRQWFKAYSGVDVRETSRDTSVCSLAIQGTELFEIFDLTLDARTAEMSLVQGPAHLRFYAGAPLITSDGIALGSLCAIDTVPRPLGLTSEQRHALTALGRHVTAMIEMRLTIAREQATQIDRQAAEARSSALLKLADKLRNSNTIADMVQAAATIAGETLRLNRAGYGTLDETCDHAEVERDWHVPGLKTLAGRHVMRSYGIYIDNLLRGETLAVSDVREDKRLVGLGFDALGIRAVLNVPVTEHGRLVALFYISHGAPHIWTQAEIAFAHDVAERTRQAAERLRAETQLRELASTLEQRVLERTEDRDRLWRSTQDVQLICDAAGILKGVNPAFTSILGWTPDEVLGRNVFDFIIPDEEASTGALQQASEQYLSAFENRYRQKDGSVRWFSWVASPEGDLVYASGRHITAEKEQAAALRDAEEALRQSQKMEAMGSLTGGVAHDFNNLLTPIIGSLDMLVRKGIGSDRERRLIDGALQSAERAKTLVQRLLAFARRQPLQPVAVDLRELVDGMAELIGSTLGPTIDVRVYLAPDLPPAKADQNQLEMALLNLAVNARDAMPNGGELTIAAKRESLRRKHASGLNPGHYVRIGVGDTGAGMDKETRKRAIEPFFSTKGIGKGTGLGLSMVHGLASQLGGGMMIESSPGEGTTVELWLPLSAEAIDDNQTEPVKANEHVGRGTVLLVDDEDLVRMSTADMLTDLGFEVVEAGSAEEALRLVQSGLNVDLLVTDHLMPGMSGAELAGEVRAVRPRTPVLIVSGYAEVDGIAPGLPRLTKPFRSGELAASLSALVPTF